MVLDIKQMEALLKGMREQGMSERDMVYGAFYMLNSAVGRYISDPSEENYKTMEFIGMESDKIRENIMMDRENG